ncbi:MAG: M14 family zinc carboxypeptidase [Chloroflexota bacterium]
MRQNRSSVSRLFAILSMALLPLLVLGGGVTNSALAETRVDVSIATSAAVTGSGILVLHVYFRDAAERDRLATELAAEEASTRNGYLTVIGDQPMANNLRARGLRVEVDNVLTYQLNNPDTFYGGYRTVEEMQAFLDQKVADFPTLVEKVDIGDSWCKTHLGQCTQPNSWNGFDLYVLHITNRNIPGPKPVFWYDAGIHSREIATPEVAMRFIDYLLNGYNTNADARWIVDYQDIWVMPMLNPDGHHMNEAGTSQPTFHRKNADKDDGCTTYDNYGTDINRNFPFQWGCCGGSDNNPCSEIFRGPAQGSEEETQALIAKIGALIPDQRGPNENDPAPITTTGTLINMHSNAQQNLYPWGYTSAYAPNRTDLRNIGRHMNSPDVLPVGNGYEYCQNIECLYIVDGDEKNWAYGVLGIPAYSLELSGNGFFPPYACLDNGAPLCTDGTVGANGIWAENKGALTYHAKIARTPYLLTRGPDTNNSPTIPVTGMLGFPVNITATINYDWSGSDNESNAYLQNVAAAEYYIDTPPWAGGVAHPMAATDGTYDEPTENVDASVDTVGLTLGRHSVFMRGRGVNDYESYQSWGPVSAVFLDVTSDGGTTTPVATLTTTAVATGTPTVPPTATTFTPGPTNTSAGCFKGAGIPVTCTPTPMQTGTPSSTPSVTPTACLIQFQDVVQGSTFYPYVRCLACLGIINGYPCGGLGEPCGSTNDPYFRPNNNVTRGQIAKIVSNSAGFTDPAGAQIYEDVQPGSTFYDFVQRLSSRGYMNGYPCGSVGEPCGSGNLPYFRPNNNATRGQITKIVSNAAGFTDPPGSQLFEDVPPGSTFYDFVQRLGTRNIMSGYPCGGMGEPCGSGNLPYFRPGANATRGQTSKIVSNTFYASCQAIKRGEITEQVSR